MNEQLLFKNIINLIAKIGDGKQQNLPSWEELKKSQIKLEETYRTAPETKILTDRSDILTYLTTRMPATYAALSKCLEKLPNTFIPKKILDLGTGPGTSLWACFDFWGNFGNFKNIDAHAELLDFFRYILDSLEIPSLSRNNIVIENQNLKNFSLSTDEDYDLVILNYVLNEFSSDDALTLIRKAFITTKKYGIIVLPGTPRDFKLLLNVRDYLINKLHAYVIAPCPHHYSCPLLDGDWCHFAARLGRSRMHKQMKSGTLGFEDEKFCYLLFSKENHNVDNQADSRIIKPPQMKPGHVVLELCTQNGEQKQEIIAKRKNLLYKTAKKKSWGDAW